MSGKFVTIQRQDTWAWVTLKREPVNSLNLEVFRELLAALDDLEKDAKIKGIVFRSGLSRGVFTAGNDINELYAPRTSEARYKEFWVVSNTFFSRLYSSPLATVAAIRGACPAGGCLLSLACDYRVMTNFGAIGLNEVALGISVPKYWMSLMEKRVGAKTASRLCQYAIMSSPQEALKLGLIDMVVSEGDLEIAAEAQLKEITSVADVARGLTKVTLTQDFAKEWLTATAAEATTGWAFLAHEGTVKQLGKYLGGLSKAKK